MIGLEESPIRDVSLSNINIVNGKEECRFENVEGLKIREVFVNGKEINIE